MGTRTIGLVFKTFYNDASWWKEGVYHEDMVIEMGGVELPELQDVNEIPDTAELKISGGWVSNEEGDDLGTLENYFRKWRKAQNMTTIAVSVPKEKLLDVETAIQQAGGKVVA